MFKAVTAMGLGFAALVVFAALGGDGLGDSSDDEDLDDDDYDEDD